MRRQNTKVNRPNSCLLIILVTIGIIVFAFVYARNWYNSAIFKGEEAGEIYEVMVNEGDTFTNVIDELKEIGLIENKLAVQIYLKTKGINPSIKTGLYQIPSEFNVPQIIEMMESGALKPATWVTIKEGLKFEEIANILDVELESSTAFNKDEFLAIASNPDGYQFTTAIQTFLNTYKPAGLPLRGFLYPDTYRIDDDMTAQQVIEAMLTNFITKFNTEVDLTKAKYDVNVGSLYDALVLASIIEKEASAWDDRAEISGVFHNRMNSGIALQSDATVNFITGKNDAGVEFADRDIDNPYNTYLYQGLPPTPINNPRMESIIAALIPNDTNYFYFYHTPDGQTFFNESFADHETGVCRDLGC